MAVSVLLVFTAACTRKAGDSCKEGVALCTGRSNGLFCTDGTLIAASCRGPLGCAADAGVLACDDSVAVANDGCVTNGDSACSPDHKAALECQGTNFAVVETCKGPKGCVLSGKTIVCDNDVAEAQDPCREEGDFACASNGKVLLLCKSGSFQPANTCRGPKGCTVREHPTENKVGFACDDTIAEAGDLCDEDGESACSVDRKTLLACKESHFAIVKPCRGGCAYEEKTDKFVCK